MFTEVNQPERIHRKELDDYLAKAKSCIRSIQRGGVDKVVLSRLIKHELDSSELSMVFHELSQQYPQSMVYLLHTQKTGTWMGAAPETLLAWNSDQAWTESLAGTSLNKNEKWDEKNISEQEIVTDFIEGLLNNYGISCYKENTKSVQKAHLTHRQTKIHFDTVDYMDHLTRQLHPTPAIHGSPRLKASQLIRKTEDHDRFLYTGYLGPIDPYLGNHLFVNIRCMEIDNAHAYLYVGGGITRLSKAEKEWKETEHKADVLRSVFNKPELQYK